MRYLVLRKQNSQKAKQFKIVAPVITIGRTSENSIALKDGTISRQHCVIETSNNVTRIRDLGSFHGFLLNEKQTRQAVLKHGDCITLGTYELYYVIKDEGEKITANDGMVLDEDATQANQVQSNGNHAPVIEEPDASDSHTDLDLSAADEMHEQKPVSRLHGSRHPVLEPDRSSGEAEPLNVELASGDFPIEVDDTPKRDDPDMNLHSLVNPAPAAKTAPKAKAPAAAPPASKPSPPKPAAPDPRIAEAENHAKQLQQEFGDLLKRFEANKKQLAKSLEALENEQLKSTTAGKKYKRAIEKITELEAQLATTTQQLTALQADEAQHHKEYHELDERLQAAEQARDEAIRKAGVLEASLENTENDKTELEAQSVKLRKTVDDLNAQVAQLQAHQSTARKKIATLETNLNTVQESRMRAKNIAVTLEKERNALQTQLDEIAGERDVYKTRTIKLEAELSQAIHGQAAAEGKIVDAQKATLSRDEKLRELEAKLSAANDTIKDLEEELEEVQEQLVAGKAASSGSGSGSGGGGGGGGGDELNRERVKKKLVAMEKERRKALALAEQSQKQLASAHQQNTVLQSFLDEREALINKLRTKLREAGGDEGTKGD